MPDKPPMNKAPTKSQLRTELQQQVRDYLEHGGEIHEIPRGVSGRNNPLEGLPMAFFSQPKAERTPIPEVVAALDARRQKGAKPGKKARSKPKEKIIYDDFGEPIRKVWVDE
ncbi:MAG: hypothetical protein EP334_05365 [Gammaproteobacteria bacterium]|nr:MAG: hypothetical protein EP334_05365 [Gammaproteobacteria bacterium]